MTGAGSDGRGIGGPWRRQTGLGVLLIAAAALAGCAGTADTPPVRQTMAVAPIGNGPWDSHIREASTRFNVPETWIRAVMQVESGGRTHVNGRPITSPAGAMGLMQIMPETWEYLRQRHGFGSDPYDPHENILAGAAYLREMYDLFGSPGFLGAYNAGPRRYSEYLATGRTLPGETRRYMARITPVVAGILPDDRAPVTMVAAVPASAPAPAVAPASAVAPAPAARQVAAAAPPPAPAVVLAPEPARGTVAVAPAAAWTPVVVAAAPAETIAPAPARSAPQTAAPPAIAPAAVSAPAPATVQVAQQPLAPSAAAVRAASPAPASTAASARTVQAPAVAYDDAPVRRPATSRQPDMQANGLPVGWYVPVAPPSG